jgi:hypothetical protein
MTNQELFKQAIADAKSVRDAAVANAKAALEETFTPKIMSMLSAKLNEMEEDDMEKGKKVEEEGKEMEKEGHEATIGYGAASQKPQIEGEMKEESYEEGAKSMEEMSLDEILAELEKEEEGKMEEGKKEDMEEAKKTEEEGKKVEEAKKDEDKKKMEESLEEAEGDDEVTELTVDELKDIIRDVLKDVMGSEEEAGEEEAGEEGEEDEVEVDDEESIDLDELLAELEKEEEGKEKVEESKDKDEDDKKMEEAKKEAKKAKEDLEEAIKVIKFLKKELNEVNLLNAKNTYVNKIFKSKNLSEAQKVNVLKSMDKATNVKEAKNIYETLTETLSVKKSSIKESVGFASKAAGVAPKQPIVESDAAIRRMQQLAGIIK